MKRPQVVPISDSLAHHGEGPLWDPVGQRIVWMDMLVGDVLITDLDGKTQRIQLADPIAALARPIAGTTDFVVVGERTIWQVSLDEPRKAPFRVMTLPWPSGVRSNDGACSPAGVLYIGSMHYGAEPGAGQVLTVTEGGCSVALDSTTISNGQQFITENSVVFVDSADGRIRRFTVTRDGTWVDPETIATSDNVPGTPDGLCVDSEGGVWAAMWDGGCVARWSSDGRLTAIIDLPVRRPTSVTLGGASMRTLFITTSALDRVPGTEPEAGSLLAVEVEVPGPFPYAWNVESAGLQLL